MKRHTREEQPARMTMTREIQWDSDRLPARKPECQGNCDRCREKKESRKEANLRKAILIPVFVALSSLPGWAQEAAPVQTQFWNDPLLPVYLIGSGIFLILILVIAVARIAYRVYHLLGERMAREKALRLGILYVPEQGWFEKLWQNANALLPLEEEKNIELDHSYDGIRELDNHLPPWWKGLFYSSILFAVVYMILFHISDSLPLPEQEYRNELSAAEDQARILKASQPGQVFDESALSFTNDAAVIARGKSIFVSSNCASCHRNDGGGNTIGPNLTDHYWLHGGDIKSIYTTIKTGVVEKAMPAWGKVMSQNDVRSLAFYVMSLQGTNPPNAKAPQGEVFTPGRTTATNDSTNTLPPLNN